MVRRQGGRVVASSLWRRNLTLWCDWMLQLWLGESLSFLALAAARYCNSRFTITPMPARRLPYYYSRSGAEEQSTSWSHY